MQVTAAGHCYSHLKHTQDSGALHRLGQIMLRHPETSFPAILSSPLSFTSPWHFSDLSPRHLFFHLKCYDSSVAISAIRVKALLVVNISPDFLDYQTAQINTDVE